MSETKVKIPCRISFANIWEPKSINGSEEPLEPGMPYAVMMDTGKKHSNGTPIRQLKWETPIVEEVKKLMPRK